ncbi:unnamed protein product [Hydatigera taeniaeformis]|uniref:Centromere protein K n=1 Tax=Hydatigena taeniaeformis TaxID=6205 RepID=A0A0R3WIH0_HYDTA|nr:unnamed protein product [Hydatigera taeniaeformis]
MEKICTSFIERSRLEEQLKETETKAALAEQELKASLLLQLPEFDELFQLKKSILKLAWRELQQIFAQNQEAEYHLEAQMVKCQRQRESEENRLNGGFLQLQNPIFTELGIRETRDFDIPEVDIEALRAKQPVIQKTF